MIDYFFKFNSKLEAYDAFRPLGVVMTDDSGNEYLQQGSEQFALSEVGEIPKANYTDESGNEVRPWHVNVRLIDEALNLSSLESFQVTVRNPINLWA